MYVWLDHSPGRPLTISVLLRPEEGGGGVKCRILRGILKLPSSQTEALSITIVPLFRSSLTIGQAPTPSSSPPRKLTNIMCSVPHVADTLAPGLASSATDGLTERYQQRQRRSYGHHWTNKGCSQKYKISQAPTV